ncbi:Phosphorelay intermediate protein [Lecanora helva]
MAARSDKAESENGSIGLPDCGDSIDPVTFEQILEMDEDEEEREFSKSIVFGFFEQAEVTFQKMDTALQEKDLPVLSSLGHFLKGSSATIGLNKVKDSCEKIQHFGSHKDEHGADAGYDDARCLTLITTTLKALKGEYQEAERILRQFYRDPDAHA